jgi:hypothetical protein
VAENFFALNLFSVDSVTSVLKAFVPIFDLKLGESGVEDMRNQC